jgi:hypothetical protein
MAQDDADDDMPVSPDPSVNPDNPTIPDPDDDPLMNEEEGGDMEDSEQPPMDVNTPRE